MTPRFTQHLAGELDSIREQGLFKTERVLTSPQRARVSVDPSGEVLNLCANNYLGLADDPSLIAAAKAALDSHGFGMASVRFICGTQDLHRALEARLARFLGTEDCILFSSCWDANGGVFEILLTEQDAVISDALNHASIIDGIRLSKARRYRYANNDMAELEARLEEATRGGARFILVVTDGVFSMDGVIADLPAIRALCDRYGAMLMVDDSHAVGFLGPSGKGSHEHTGTLGKIDLLTGTLGKALGGASGGYVASTTEVVALLRQRARPYLFSNSLMPAIAAATLRCLDLLEQGGDRRARLSANAAHFRSRMSQAGFTLAGAGHPIIPVMLYDAKVAVRFAEALLKRGIYVIAFSYPVVPQGKARIRTQMSAAHTTEQLDQAIDAFIAVGKELEVIR